MTNMNPDSAEIMDIVMNKSTLRSEYIRCSNPECTKRHGPYLYAYWKDKGKLKKKYVGKSIDHYIDAQLAKEAQVSPREFAKIQYIIKHVEQGNKTAIMLEDKIKKSQITHQTAYKRLYEEISGWRLYVMTGIAKKKNVEYEGIDELMKFIDRDMKLKGFTASEDNLDEYLKSQVSTLT